jgi:hypothetical protein
MKKMNIENLKKIDTCLFEEIVNFPKIAFTEIQNEISFGLCHDLTPRLEKVFVEELLRGQIVHQLFGVEGGTLLSLVAQEELVSFIVEVDVSRKSTIGRREEWSLVLEKSPLFVVGSDPLELKQKNCNLFISNQT